MTIFQEKDHGEHQEKKTKESDRSRGDRNLFNCSKKYDIHYKSNKSHHQQHYPKRREAEELLT